MDRDQVHYELFVRRQAHSSWTLDMAGEDRSQVLETAQVVMAERRAVAVKVVKETLDRDTREFKSVTIHSAGLADGAPRAAKRTDLEPLCVAPSDLYTLHARDRIGRLLEQWLARQRATPFELLHRADLVEKLEAAGVELQHAVQKIAVPEAQERGLSVHEVIRSFQGLIDRAVQRLVSDQQKGAFPDLAKEGFAGAARRLAGAPELGYLLGGGVAGILARADSWNGKVSRLMDLADEAPPEEPLRSIALQVLEQPLSEILRSRVGLAELLGQNDLGSGLAAMTRMAGGEMVEALIAAEPGVARVMPPLEGPASRLAGWLQDKHFEGCRIALGVRVLAELKGPRRLRPGDPAGEIVLLRALARALIAASGRLLPIEDVQEAFSARSKTLVASDFVTGLIGEGRTAVEEAEVVILLGENVVGPMNKRQAGRYLSAVVAGLRFETEARGGAEGPAARLAKLAELQRSLGRAGLPEEERMAIAARIGEVGGMVEADARLTLALVAAKAPLVQRLDILLRLATGEAAPLGPAADRARAEVLKLLKAPGAVAEIGASPALMGRVRQVLQAEAA